MYLAIGQYFNKGTFIIPNYQRGYKWGVPDNEEHCAVSVLMISLINAFESKQNEYFIQGVTVCEENKSIWIIDGQQRTTTFFLLLKYLGFGSLPKIEYAIREETRKLLDELKGKNTEELNEFSEKDDFEKNQDVFYFKKAIRTISNSLKAYEPSKLEEFKTFLLNKVKLFYIIIAKDKATKVFSMMNGQKAIMKNDELVKAALLSKASRQNEKFSQKDIAHEDLNDILQKLKNKVAEEWEVNSLRSKYAREWDKWLYWWNKKEVKEFFGSL